MTKPVGIGSLFEDRAHKQFYDVTRARYSSMSDRMKRKKLPPLPFTLEQFRQDVLSVMGGKVDGAVQCRYCHTHFALDGVAVDHAIPLSRRGSSDLTNLDYPCKPCNDKKGSLTHIEFTKLLEFLEKEIPLGRQDVLSRLEKAVKLASGAFANQGTISHLKKTGQWQAVQAARRAKKNSKLGKF